MQYEGIIDENKANDSKSKAESIKSKQLTGSVRIDYDALLDPGKSRTMQVPGVGVVAAVAAAREAQFRISDGRNMHLRRCASMKEALKTGHLTAIVNSTPGKRHDSKVWKFKVLNNTRNIRLPHI